MEVILKTSSTKQSKVVPKECKDFLPNKFI